MSEGSGLAAIGGRFFKYRSWFPPVLAATLVPGLRHADPAAPPGLDPQWAMPSLGLVAIGFAIRAAVVGTVPHGTSGRNTNRQIAAELNTTGLYSVLRHPLYLGNLCLWLGLAVATGRWWALLVTMLAFGGFYGVIMVTEDTFLARQFGPRFATWAAKTPALVPRPSLWRPPGLAFSGKVVCRQEYYGWFTTAFFFAALDVAARWLNGRTLAIGTGWLILLVVMTLVSGTLRFLQRSTHVLDVPGR